MAFTKNEQVLAAVSLENALKWEQALMDDKPGSTEKQDAVCREALGIDENHPKAGKLVSLLEDELHAIVQSQRNLRALGMGTAPLNAAPIAKVEGKKACQRCGGTGIVAQYKHINGGQCYACGGSGKNKKFH